eukprot:CAMPEP_0170336888 /NCGR_PEP_ID=MMETSP0116_2-20130129/69488_1 /TAXON_ID=400756 /ORGANISM="Durinskia baltica, Strain CSIRO CS-38" /LENGTH=91 /DNA_ID=CAMNT_0010590279 /DNA_START=295 /DNA_END=571 /DNA_ORIENTATION=-
MTKCHSSRRKACRARPPAMRSTAAGLRHAESALGHRRDIEVAKFGDHPDGRAAQEDVGALHVAMQNVHLVQGLKPVAHPDVIPPQVNLAQV